jgi:hypothetical protein
MPQPCISLSEHQEKILTRNQLTPQEAGKWLDGSQKLNQSATLSFFFYILPFIHFLLTFIIFLHPPDI